jgi:hypothetical protein
VTDIAKTIEALKKARPIVEETARWHRDMQSSAGKTASVYKVLDEIDATLSSLSDTGSRET